MAHSQRKPGPHARQGALPVTVSVQMAPHDFDCFRLMCLRLPHAPGKHHGHGKISATSPVDGPGMVAMKDEASLLEALGSIQII